MSPLDIFWHLSNLFLPAVGLGLIAPALAKAVWWRELKSVRYARLVAWCMPSAAVCVIGGLLLLGRDGRMSTYAVMGLVSASVLWWVGFGPGRRRAR